MSRMGLFAHGGEQVFGQVKSEKSDGSDPTL